MRFRFVLLLAVYAATLTAAPRVKPFELEIEPGKTEYTVTPPFSGTFWIVSESRAVAPVAREHFADLRWDGGLPFRRRILTGVQAVRQEKRQITLGRVVFEKGVPRKLHFTFEPR